MGKGCSWNQYLSVYCPNKKLIFLILVRILKMLEYHHVAMTKSSSNVWWS